MFIACCTEKISPQDRLFFVHPSEMNLPLLLLVSTLQLSRTQVCLASFLANVFCARPDSTYFKLHQSLSPQKAMAPHSSALAWRIPWTEEPGGLQSMGSWIVGHDWATSLSLFTFHFHALEKEMATHSNVLAWRIPGIVEPGGLPSMGLHRVRHNRSNLAATAAAAF